MGRVCSCVLTGMLLYCYHKIEKSKRKYYYIKNGFKNMCCSAGANESKFVATRRRRSINTICFKI